MASGKKKKEKQENLTQAKVSSKVAPQAALPQNFWYYLIPCVVITAVAFINAMGNGFCWDDGGYIVQNPIIKSLSADGLKMIFTEPYGGNYHPLTALTNAIEWSFVLDRPQLYHVDNLIIHLVNVGLVFWLLWKMTARIEAAVIVALFFGVHPLRVESVSWIAERKDVLYTCFFLLALIVYINYIKGQDKTRNWILAFVFFVIACLSKSAAVCLPVLFFVFDYFYKRKFDFKLLIEKVPFLILSLVFGVVALKSQASSGALDHSRAAYSFLDRILLVLYSMVFYIVELFVPYKLSLAHIYPPLVNGMLPMEYYLAPLVLIGIAVWIYKATAKRRVLLTGFGFYFITIALVLQLVPFGWDIVSERYSYVPHIGLLFIVASYLLEYSDKASTSTWKLKAWLTGVLALLVVGCVFATWQRNKVWKDDITLFSDVIEKDPNVSFAYSDRGILLMNKGQLKEALSDFNNAIRLDPDYGDALYNRALVRDQLNDLTGGIADYDHLLHVVPNHSLAYFGRGNLRIKTGDLNGAIADFTKSLQLNPNLVNAYYNRALQYDKQGKTALAIGDYNAFITARKDMDVAFLFRGNDYFQMGNLNAAMDDFNTVIKMNPKNIDAYYNRGIVFVKMNRMDEACPQFQTALQMGHAGAQAMLNQYCKK